MNDIKKKGDLGLVKAILWLTENGFTVYTPLTDNEVVDLVGLRDGVAFRVSVKATSAKTPYGSYETTLKTVSRRKDNKVKVNHFDASRLDLLLVYIIPEDRVVCLKAEEVTSKSSICVR